MRALVCVVLLGCTKPAPPTTTATGPSSSASVAAAPSDAGSVPGFPPPDFGPRGPAVAIGYPTKIGTGMDDTAELVGFTTDGTKFGYCGHHGGLGQLNCVTKDAAGKETVESDLAPTGSAPPLDPAKTAALKAWMASSGLIKLARVKGSLAWNPPPLKGDWAYARDIQLVVTTAEGTTDRLGRQTAQPFVTLGGVLKGETAVSIVTSSAPHRPIGDAGEIPYHFTVVNGLHVSPDGNEIGMVTHSYCMEYCDEYEIVRMNANAFAGRVYNDTGFRHHKKGEFARSAELFALAAFADASSDLYAYNLACALARTNDAKAPLALTLAIARGGDKIKARARDDADFEGVKTSAWFVDQTK